MGVPRAFAVILRSMEFEWDPNKAAANLAKHKVSFREAATVFSDLLSITFDDPDHSEDEERFIIIGTSASDRLLIVAHTDLRQPYTDL